MNMQKRKFNAILAAGILSLTAGSWFSTAAAQGAYPSKPVRLIVPFPPAGLTDILARIVAQKLSDISGQPFIVENRAGAGGNIGMEAMVRAPADGYTIAMIITSHAINMSMPQKASYDVTKDLAPVRLLTTSNNVLVVNPSIPAKSAEEFIKLATSKEALLSFASSGNGTSPHLSGVLFNEMTGAHMMHVPYRGAGPAMIDLIGGNVQLMFDAISTAAPHIKEGKIRALGVTGLKRSPILPDVPTLDEAGLPGYSIEGWLGIVAPKNTPVAAVNWLSEQLSAIMLSPEVNQKVLELGMSVSNMPPEEFKSYLESEVAKWGKLVAKSEVKNG